MRSSLPRAAGGEARRPPDTILARRCGEGTTSLGLIGRTHGERRGLPRQFWLLTVGTLIYLTGIDMLYPFEAMYLDRVLGVSSTAIGLILGVPLLLSLPMQIMGGALCDRWGRRPVLMMAVIGSATLAFGLAFAQVLWIVIVLFAFEAAFGWAQYITASNAMIADLAPFERRAEAYSITRVALNAGTTMGPLLAAPLLLLDPTFRTPFIVSGLVCLAFLTLVATRFQETRPPGTDVTSVAIAFKGYGVVMRDRRMLAFSLAALLPLFGFGQIWITLPLMLGKLQGLSPERWSLALVVYGGSTTLLQYPVVRALRRADHLMALALASVLIGAGLSLASITPWPQTLGCMLLLSIGIVILIPIAATVVSALAPPELRGRYMGAWTLVYMGGYALGPLIGAWLLDVLGGHGVAIVNLAAGSLGAVLFLVLSRAGVGRRRTSGKKPGSAAREAVSGPDAGSL